MAKAHRAPAGSQTPKAPTSEPSADSTPTREGNRPVHAIRYRGCEAAIWKNASDKEREFFSVTVRKSWRDDKGEWHDGQTFLTSDLPMLAKAITDAHSWIAWQERQKNGKAGKGSGR